MHIIGGFSYHLTIILYYWAICFFEAPSSAGLDSYFEVIYFLRWSLTFDVFQLHLMISFVWQSHYFSIKLHRHLMTLTFKRIDFSLNLILSRLTLSLCWTRLLAHHNLRMASTVKNFYCKFALEYPYLALPSLKSGESAHVLLFRDLTCRAQASLNPLRLARAPRTY